MKHSRAFIFSLLCLFLSLRGHAEAEIESMPNLSFQADIYGDTGLETISYRGDLDFENHGGFGINAPIFVSSLRSGDGVMFGVSASEANVLSLEVIEDSPEKRGAISQLYANVVQ